MKIENRDKSILKVIIIAIAFYFAVLRFDGIIILAKRFFLLTKPFLIGGAIAFIINVPMVKIEKMLEKADVKKGRRRIAFLLTIIILTAAVSAFLMIVIPQLSRTISALVLKLQTLIDEIPALLERHSENFTFMEEYILSLNINWKNIGQQIITWLQNFAVAVIGSGSGMVGGIIGGFTTCIFAVIFAVYILLGKERNTAALNRFSKAVFGEKISGRINYVCSLSYKVFSNFLSGQCLEAIILGSMFVVSMTFLRLPYAFLIGAVIAVTALIPVFGAFMGCAVGILLIAIESPVKAVIFVVLFLVLQQIEGNIIYPKVVGNSIGLPSILVFMSVIIGNSLMGVLGMILFIPLSSVAYTLIKEFVVSKEEKSVV